jgi:4-oxalocrotonate tautomerase
MPHVKIQHFPRVLSQSAKNALAEEITRVITQALQCDAGVVSIAIEQVSADDWQTQVYRPEIENKKDCLIKVPNY